MKKFYFYDIYKLFLDDPLTLQSQENSRTTIDDQQHLMVFTRDCTETKTIKVHIIHLRSKNHDCCYHVVTSYQGVGNELERLLLVESNLKI
jgi:hypothetical protein